MELIVSIECNGKQCLAGIIEGSSGEDACFRYAESYLQDPNTAPISISLPKREEPFSVLQTKNYFEGLLPEGFTRRTVAQWMHVDENDYLSILHGLGRECLGAIQIRNEEEVLNASYEAITNDEIQALAEEGVSKSAEIITKAHLSLTGASGKVGLYYDKDSDRWFLPRGTAPSTHIVKQSHVRLNDIVTNEQLTLLTAQRCGIDIPNSFIVNTGTGKDNEVLFATARYDRSWSDHPAIVDGLPCPNRLHQEDFAQAQGILSSEKYEKRPSGYMRKMFETLRRYSSDPIQDQLKLWDIVVFNYLVGNTDAHIKNSSLLYGADMRSLRLAPAYDLVSTTVYDQSTREMAFFIGEDLQINKITRKSFQSAAKEIGISVQMAMERFDSMRLRFIPALKESAERLCDEGYPMADVLMEKVLTTGGIQYC
ncbi:MAG: type II toxin-antitoxin system HipA family toxin [Oscillospiraceae bacterium]|nr:type II toxin-antitoxin system HipA family toxin [Oscillospiraceae bacterium]